MSTTRTYNLRTRTDANAAAPSRGDTRPEPVPAVALYSDIAASRPPSPRRERLTSPDEPVEHPSAEVDSEGVYGYSRTDRLVSIANEQAEIRNITSSRGSDRLREPEENQWTTVRRPGSRARSLDSISRVPRNFSREQGVVNPLTQEQARTVQVAERAMGVEQKRLLQQRQQNIAVLRELSHQTRGEGTSNTKGKNIDPRNWGDANLSHEDLDIAAQAAALQAFARKNEQGKNTLPKESNQKKKEKRSARRQKAEPAQRPAESRPAAQIAKSSYLGMALRSIGKHHRDHDSVPSSQGSSDSSGSPGSSEDESNDGTSTNGDRSDSPVGHS